MTRKYCHTIVFAVAFLLPLTGLYNASGAATKNVLLIGQNPDGHARGSHEYMAGVRILAACLQGVENLDVQVVYGREPWTDGPEMIRDADGVVLFVSQGARWMQADPRRYQALVELASRGGGLGAIHWAVGAKDAQYRDGQIKLHGASRGGKRRPFGFFTTTLGPAQQGHPVLRGIEPLKIKDEFYYQLNFVQPADGIQPLMTAEINGQAEVVAWSWQRPGGGRSFGFTGLHFHKNWEAPQYRRLLANATVWSVGLPVPEKGLPVDIDDDQLKLRDTDRQPPANKQSAEAAQ